MQEIDVLNELDLLGLGISQDSTGADLIRKKLA